MKLGGGGSSNACLNLKCPISLLLPAAGNIPPLPSPHIGCVSNRKTVLVYITTPDISPPLLRIDALMEYACEGREVGGEPSLLVRVKSTPVSLHNAQGRLFMVSSQ